jgi:FkbM family methyltransferase
LLANSLQPKRILAFEPDPTARSKAQELFLRSNLKVELHDFALSNTNSTMYMNFLDGEEGSGSTYIGRSGQTPVRVRRIDSLDLSLEFGGALWLDVEGHAVQVLQGASNIFAKLKVAKVEVQMHDMHESRCSDLFQVNKLMKSQGLIPIRGPLFPGFFGDVIYVNRRETTTVLKIWSNFLLFQLHFLHRIIYPVLNKPAIINS